MAKTKRTFTSRWFRVYDEVVDDPKIQQLGDKLTVFWLNCMCLASKNDGYLPPVADIAWKLRKPEAAISSMIATLYERGLLDQQGDTFSPHNWEQRQYISDSSTERVRRYRERMKRPSNENETFPKRDETVSVTPSDTETETETEQNKPQTPFLFAPPMPKLTPIPVRSQDPPSQNFERWWKTWSAVKGTNHRPQAENAYFRLVTVKNEAEAHECTQSYLASLMGSGGYNPENFLEDQAIDEFRARWPPRAAFGAPAGPPQLSRVDKLIAEEQARRAKAGGVRP